jgi:hypothetical protein
VVLGVQQTHPAPVAVEPFAGGQLAAPPTGGAEERRGRLWWGRC